MVWEVINEVLFTSVLSGRRRPNSHVETFNEWVSDFNLIDLPLQQVEYTWSNTCGYLLGVSTYAFDFHFVF